MIIGCNKPVKNNNMLSFQTEKTERVLVVIEDDLWLSELGDTIRNYLAAGIEGMIPFEPIFDLDQQSPNVFFKGSMTRKNVVVFTAFGDNRYFELNRNKHATPQNYFVIEGTDIASTMSNFLKHKDSIINRFYRQELDDMIDNVNKERLRNTPYLIDKYNVQLRLPEAYKRILADDNFVWFKKDIASGNSNIIAYALKKNLLNTDIYSNNFATVLEPIRNEIVGKYVHSIEPGSSIFIRMDEYNYRKKVFYGKYRALELKGFWDMDNSFMSGSYLSYVLDSPQNDYYIFFDGFTYNPSMNKRALMLEIEAIFNSFELDH